MPLIGVNIHLPKDRSGEITNSIELIRSTEEVKNQQIGNVRVYQTARNALSSGEDDAGSAGALRVLQELQKTAREMRNLFEGLMEAVKYHSLGHISHALYEVGVSEECVGSFYI